MYQKDGTEWNEVDYTVNENDEGYVVEFETDNLSDLVFTETNDIEPDTKAGENDSSVIDKIAEHIADVLAPVDEEPTEGTESSQEGTGIDHQETAQTSDSDTTEGSETTSEIDSSADSTDPQQIGQKEDLSENELENQDETIPPEQLDGQEEAEELQEPVTQEEVSEQEGLEGQEEEQTLVDGILETLDEMLTAAEEALEEAEPKTYSFEDDFVMIDATVSPENGFSEQVEFVCEKIDEKSPEYGMIRAKIAD